MCRVNVVNSSIGTFARCLAATAVLPAPAAAQARSICRSIRQDVWYANLLGMLHLRGNVYYRPLRLSSVPTKAGS
jgi:hypothetical protein